MQSVRAHRRVVQAGQAVVEFALAATLIFFLLSAAVDLGLVFFTLQGINNATAEGANWGSTSLTSSGDLDTDGIRDRIRKEAGMRGGIGFVNLLDLNNNGTVDVTNISGCSGAPSEPTVGNSCAQYDTAGGIRVIDSFITVRAVRDDTLSGFVDTTSPTCSSILTMISQGTPCYVYVEVTYNYRPVFPLAPAIGGGILPITSRYYVQIRSAAGRGDPNATVTTATICTVPNMIGVLKNNVAGIMAGQNPPFIAVPTYRIVGGSTNWAVTRQSHVAGTTVPCTTQLSFFQT